MLKGIGIVDADIAYGGNFYGIIDAQSVGLELTPENASKIIEIGIKIRNMINQKTEIVHPQYPFIRGLTHIEFFTEPTQEEADVKIRSSSLQAGLIVHHAVQVHQPNYLSSILKRR